MLIPGVDCKRASRLKQYLDLISCTVSKLPCQEPRTQRGWALVDHPYLKNRDYGDVLDTKTPKDIGCRTELTSLVNPRKQRGLPAYFASSWSTNS